MLEEDIENEELSDDEATRPSGTGNPDNVSQNEDALNREGSFKGFIGEKWLCKINYTGLPW